MAYRNKRPTLNMALFDGPPNSATPPASTTVPSHPSLQTSSSDYTPSHTNATSLDLASALPGAKYESGYTSSKSSSHHDMDSFPPNQPPLQSENSEIISESSYRSPSLGLSIHGNYVRVKSKGSSRSSGPTSANDRTLAVRNSRPWTTHLQNVCALGRGACSTVYKAVWTPHPGHPPTPPYDLYALKTCPIHDKARSDQLLMEIKLLANLSCPCLVMFEGAFFKRHEISLVLEYMNGGDLDHLIAQTTIPEKPLAAIFYQILHGLSYLHWYNLTHRDIKPGNVLMNSAGYVKLSDFGIASNKHLSQSASMNQTVVGTSLYMSPERLSGQRYDHGSDMWSAGLCILEAVTGRRTFESMSVVEVVITIDEWDGSDLDALCELDLSEALSGGLREMITMCLLKDMKKRMKSSLLIKAPHLKACGTETLEKSVAVMQKFLEAVFGEKDESDVSTAMIASMEETGTLPDRYRDLADSWRERRADEGKAAFDDDDEADTIMMEASLKAMSIDDGESKYGHK